MKREAIPIWLVFYCCAGICISNSDVVHIFLLMWELHILFGFFFFSLSLNRIVAESLYCVALISCRFEGRVFFASVMVGFWSALYLCRGIHLHRGCIGRKAVPARDKARGVYHFSSAPSCGSRCVSPPQVQNKETVRFDASHVWAYWLNDWMLPCCCRLLLAPHQGD